MPSIVKWGVIGSGGIARRRTIPEGIAAAPNARLAAVFDVDAEANRAVAAQFGGAVAESVENLLQQDVDAIYIASPAKAHYGHVLACAAGGKHILCEKPLGMTVAEAEEMVAATRAAGVVRRRIDDAVPLAAPGREELIDEGRLGKPVYGRAQLSCWYPPIPGAWRRIRHRRRRFAHR